MKGGNFMKTKKLLTAVLLIVTLVLAVLPAYASEELPIGYWNIVYPYRYLIFATDGGSYIRELEKMPGEHIDLKAYIPTKEGYIFDGWYLDAKDKQNKVTELELNQNTVVYAKWIDDGSSKAMSTYFVTPYTTAEAMAYGNYRDEVTGVPVTALWVQQHTRLKELMARYNQKFNN